MQKTFKAPSVHTTPRLFSLLLLTAIFTTIFCHHAQAQQPTLNLTISPTTFSEAAGPNAATGTVTASVAPTSALTINLSSNDTTEAIVPATITLAAGATTATFNIAAVDDTILDGPQQVTIIATATGYQPSAAIVTVTDNEVAPTPTPVPTATPVPTPTATPVPALTVTVAPNTISEGAGANAATGVVTRNTGTTGDLTVNLFSSDTSEVRVPTTVVIPAGATSASFSITAVNDTIVDGSQIVGITASATGFIPGRTRVTVTDNDVPTLRLTVTPSTISEGAGANAATGTITRNTSAATDLAVNLVSSDTSEVRVPTAILIPAGATSVSFPITAVDDRVIDGSQVVGITASASGFLPGRARVTVTDNDVVTPTPTPTATPIPGPTLTLSITPNTISEGAGANAAIGTVTRNTPTTEALTVNLVSSDISEARVPATVVIPAGAISVNFAVAAINDTIADGTQVVGITATASGFTPGRARVNVADDEPLPPIPTPTPVATPTPVPTPVATPTPVGTATLTLSVEPSTFSEAAGTGAAIGTVTRNTATTEALTVNLTSSDISEVRVPATVTIPAGSASATFNITAVNDTQADGTQEVGITASASGFIPGRARVNVTDDEALPTPTPDPTPTPTPEPTPVPTPTPTPQPGPTLSFIVGSNTISEGAGSTATIGIVTRTNADTSSPLTVNLTSSDNSELTVPSTVTIAAGATSASFAIAAIDDNANDGPQSVTITANAPGFTSSQLQVTVIDNEGAQPTPTPSPAPALTLVVGTDVLRESAGTSTTMGLVTRNTDTSSALTVNLVSSDTSELRVPSSITIPAGAASASFVITAVDDAVVDGPQVVGITASASGFTPGRTRVTVNDDDAGTTAALNRGTAPSAVRMSSATARAATDSVQLRFTGRLDAEIASDPTHYRVEVNGRVVSVESAGYSAQTNTVTLGLAEGSLRVGDRVVVRWNGLLSPGGGKVVGRTAPLIAR